jgi:hypothetical protein
VFNVHFLERCGDIEEVMGNIWEFFQVAAAVSLCVSHECSACLLPVAQNTRMRWVDRLWKENPLVSVSAMRSPIADFGEARIEERFGRTANNISKAKQKDFLSSFIREVKRDPTLPKL